MAFMQNVRCCGIGEVYGLSGSSAAQIEAVIAEYQHVKGLVFATTTQNQRPAERELEATGFSLVTEFRNPNSGNTIKFWIRPAKLTTTLKPMPRSAYRYVLGGLR